MSEERQLRVLAKLAAGLAHDLNNVIGGISNIAGAAIYDAEGGPLAEDLRQIIRTSKDGIALTQRLAALGRAKSPRPEQVEARGAVEQALRALKLPPSIATIEVPAGCSVQADPKLLHEALCALVQNASDATGGAGPLWVRWREEGARVAFEVADQAGQLPSHPETLWEPYASSKAGGRGTGLGLTVAWACAVAHHGALDLFAAEGETRARLWLSV